MPEREISDEANYINNLQPIIINRLYIVNLCNRLDAGWFISLTLLSTFDSVSWIVGNSWNRLVCEV
jgi:hypothetical protein